MAYKKMLDSAEMLCVSLAERGWVPDPVIRLGIRTYLAQRLKECALDGNVETQSKHLQQFVTDLKSRNIAEQTDAANKQHYEVPTELYLMMLGPWLKYSSGFWPKPDSTLQDAEEAMLALVCERAQLDELKAGDTVLDLGCGWGSCALFIAKKYPKLKITCVSNSETQQEFIREKAKEMGLDNVTPQTCDVNVMTYPAETFDRVCSTEMFEHMKNYQKLLEKIGTWLKPNGKLFVHIFTHKEFTYHFEKGWMAQTFFTGGTMPGRDLLLKFNDSLVVENQWAINGNHYSKTLEAWLSKIDDNTKEFKKLCEETYGKENGNKWVFNWRLFHIACSELFKYNGGNEWFVSHYRFVKKAK